MSHREKPGKNELNHKERNINYSRNLISSINTRPMQSSDIILTKLSPCLFCIVQANYNNVQITLWLLLLLLLLLFTSVLLLLEQPTTAVYGLHIAVISLYQVCLFPQSLILILLSFQLPQCCLQTSS